MALQPPPINPLRETDCDCLNNVCKSCERTKDLIDRAKAAGYDMSQAELINNQQRELAQQTKAQFFPDRA